MATVIARRFRARGKGQGLADEGAIELDLNVPVRRHNGVRVEDRDLWVCAGDEVLAIPLDDLVPYLQTRLGTRLPPRANAGKRGNEDERPDVLH